MFDETHFLLTLNLIAEEAFNRSSRSKVFCKGGVLRNVAKFTGKHLYRRLFLKKNCKPRPANLIKPQTHCLCPISFSEQSEKIQGFKYFHF